jgi:DNA-binding transcriptional regulator YhcF (GntR family)
MFYIREIRSSDLTTAQKITAIMIASHYDFSKGEPAFPSNKLLAKETGLAVSTIVKAKKVLSQRAYLCYQVRWDNSCIYTPMLPDIRGYATKEKLNTHINTHINTHLNTQLNAPAVQEFIEDISTDSIIDISPVAFVTGNGTALKELTPAETDGFLPW